MADIIYTYRGGVYVNVTNKCPCSCVFCIRANGDGLGSAETLWHKNEPTVEEIIAAIKGFDFTGYDEVVFCGYGEPFAAFEKLLAACKYIKENLTLKIRINTNGLGDMINGFSTLPKIAPYVDTMSISLNAPDPKIYCEVTRPVYGPDAFFAMLKFAKDSKAVIPNVVLTVVDVIHEGEIERCRELCDRLGIPLRVRAYD